MKKYRIEYTHRNWAREPRSPLANATVTYSDPSAAHEAALRLKAQGHANIRIVPFEVES